MVEVIGDIVEASELIVPRKTDGSVASISGQMFISGALLMYVDSGGTMKTLTGA